MYRQILISCALTLASSCASYTADNADATVIATEVRARQGGSFTFEQAVAMAFRLNPELRALDARARAAGAAYEPLDMRGEYHSGREMLSLMVDPVALLNLGARGARNDALDAAAEAAAVELATARWLIAADLAEVFAIEAVLGSLTVPEIAVDPDAFERAGLASPVDAARVRAARAGATAERSALDAERARNLTLFRRLVGLPMSADALILPTMFAQAPDHRDVAILARPDLKLATARFRFADATFREAVAAQYPAVQIGPEFLFTGDPLEWMSVLHVPIGAAGRAEAAGLRREAARAELEAAFLEASREARDAELAIAAAEAEAAAARAAMTASREQLAAALTAVDVDVDAFAQVAHVAATAVRDTTRRRMAEITRRRALHDLDVAHGWPAVVLEPAKTSSGGLQP